MARKKTYTCKIIMTIEARTKKEALQKMIDKIAPSASRLFLGNNSSVKSFPLEIKDANDGMADSETIFSGELT